MTVNHDVVGSSPTAGVIRHLPKFYLGFFIALKRARTIVLALLVFIYRFLDNQVNKKSIPWILFIFFVFWRYCNR